uniref:Sel1 repeat family protein n=1 Tax=Spongospora subterranea TaxID=70186 RepID=A0A0H5RLM6_9EUKA|eukprot:CRZ09634.1 hypothetical protein [Spongospora subterranea]
MADSLGLLQMYNTKAFVIVNKDLVEQGMAAESAASRRRWPVVTFVTNAVQRASQALSQRFRQQTFPDDNVLFARAFSGDADAQYNLGLLLEQGTSIITPDPEMATLWYKRAAAKGHHNALLQLEPNSSDTVHDNTALPFKFWMNPFFKAIYEWRPPTPIANGYIADLIKLIWRIEEDPVNNDEGTQPKIQYLLERPMCSRVIAEAGLLIKDESFPSLDDESEPEYDFDKAFLY